MTDQRDDVIQKLGSLIEDIEVAMLTTADEDGTLRSRPMATQKAKFDGTLWFFTGEDSGKVGEIGRSRQVNLSYADPRRQNYVSVSGPATLVRDPAKIEELWSPALRAWFPKGQDDPNVALIRVDVAKAEYWDAPSSAIVHLVGFVKAMVTGQPAKGGENEKVSLR